MKNTILVTLIFSSISLFGQYNSYYNISKLEVETSSSGIFLKSNEMFTSAFRLGPKAINSLKNGLKKAVEWIDLNEIHKKSFEKNICRFRVLKKEIFLKNGYSEWKTQEMILRFKGRENGSFDLVLLVEKDYPDPENHLLEYCEFYSKEGIQNIIDELDRKSDSEKINKIFQ